MTTDTQHHASLVTSADDVLDNLPCGVVSTLPDGTIIHVNETFVAWSGQSRDHLMGGRRFQDFLTLPGRIFYETHLVPLLRMQGHVKEISCQLQRKDQAPLQILVNANLKRGPEGEPLVIRIAVFDATDRAAYEQELRRMQSAAQYLAAIVASSGDAIVSVGLDAVVRSWNPGAVALFGYSEAEAIGKSVDDLIVPEELRSIRVKKYQRLAAGETVVFKDTVRLRKDGTLAEVEITASPMFDATGQVTAASLIFRDISERKRGEARLRESEGKLRLGIRVAGTGLGVMDYIAGTITLDAAAAELFDLPANQPLPRSDLHQRFHPDDLPVVMGAIAATLAPDSDGFMSIDHRVLRPDGSTIWVSARKQVEFLMGPDGRRRPAAGFVAVLNITERKRTEEALRTSEIRYRALAEASTTVVWRTDPNGEVVFGSDAWNGVTGQTDAERNGWGWLDAIHPDDRGPTIAKWTQSLETLTIHENEFRVRTRSGDYRRFSVRGVPIFSPDGSVQEWVGANTDIDDERSAEEALRLSENRYRRLFEAARDGVLLVDPATLRIVDANPFMALLLGQTRKELIGQQLQDVGFLVDAQASSDLLRSLKVQRQVRYEDLALQGKSGTRHEVEVVANLYDEDGAPIIQCNVRDITERRRIEAELREKEHFLVKVTDITPNILRVVDIEERSAIFVNRSLTTLLGFTPKEFAEGGEDVTASLLHPDDRPQFEEHMARIRGLADGEVADFEHRLRDRDGNWHWFLSHDSVFARDASGAVRQVIGAASEITDRKRDEVELRDSAQRMALAAETTGIGIWEWNVRTNKVLWDAQMFRIYGMQPTSDGYVDYQTWLATLLPEDVAPNDDVLRDTVRRSGKSTREFRVMRADTGEIRTIQAVEAMRAVPGGGSEWVVGTNVDITERKLAETALRRSHDTYLKMIENNPFGVYLIDSDFRMVQFSAGAQRMFGAEYPLIGRDFEEIVRLLWKEPIASEFITRFRHTLATGEHYHSKDTTGQRADMDTEESYDWQVERVTLPNGNFGVVCYFYDLTERKRYEQRIQLLMGEVNHRAKNLLSVVQAIARQTARSSDPSTFAIQLSERVRGLAASQDLLVKNQWKNVAVSELVRAQLIHFTDKIGTRVLIEGAPAHLSPSAAQGIGMALHELATNAVKYGALSDANGRIFIHWETGSEPDKGFTIQWREEGGPPVEQPLRKGFGHTVIERMAASAVDGEVEIEYRRRGLFWKLTAPLNNLVED